MMELEISLTDEDVSGTLEQFCVRHHVNELLVGASIDMYCDQRMAAWRKRLHQSGLIAMWRAA